MRAINIVGRGLFIYGDKRSDHVYYTIGNDLYRVSNGHVTDNGT